MSKKKYANYEYNSGCLIDCIKFIIVIGLIIDFISFLNVVYAPKMSRGILIDKILPFIILTCLISLVCLYKKINTRKYESKSLHLEKECERKIYYNQKEYETKENILKKIIEDSKPFIYSASLAADMHIYVFEQNESYMLSKPRPAFKAQEEVAKLKKKTKEAILNYKQMLYKYEFLLSTFPELKAYVDDEEALQSLSKENCFEDLKNSYDYSRDYLSDQEWKALEEDDRNQLALDRYKNRPKTNWTVGMLYEMYIGYLLRDRMSVIQNGITNGLEDLGRDLIARKRLSDGSICIYIIQCKNWSQNKEIHENVICQLFGTSMEYRIKNKCDERNEIVYPVLFTTTKLSEMATIFAKRLGVVIRIKPLGDFPMIKCNINNGTKIYHLPFDQQYWNTKIEKPGEFYAWTIREASAKGFRRAFRRLQTK